jgi:hypothetical protein
MLARPIKGIKKLLVDRDEMLRGGIERTFDEFALLRRRAGPMDSIDVLAGYSAKEGLFFRVTPLLC